MMNSPCSPKCIAIGKIPKTECDSKEVTRV